MFRFQRRLNDLELPGVGLKLVDFLRLPEKRREANVDAFNTEFDEGFLVSTFPTVRLCRTMDCYNPMIRVYVKERNALQAEGKPTESFEDWSRHSAVQHAPDYVSLPHHGVRWFEIRRLSNDRRVGVMQISKIELLQYKNRVARLCGHALMTLPDHPRLSYGEFWGEILKEMLETPFELTRNPARRVLFEEWVLLKDPELRFITRPGFTFGRDVMRRLGVGTLVEHGDGSKEFAPLNVRKIQRRARETKATLRQMREDVVADA